MPAIDVRRVEFGEIEPMRQLYRAEHSCQIIHDSILARGLADPYLILVDGRTAGYGGVWNQYDPDRVMEFHTLPAVREFALPMFREFIAASGATSMEAQTNMPLMTLMLLDCATGLKAENYLFHDGFTSRLDNPGGELRAAEPGKWAIVVDGAEIASGGVLCHYNPPYGDLYMDVEETFRRRGYGSYLVQELKRLAYEFGKKPAARCRADNTASRRTLEKAGMLPCGRLMTGVIAR